MLTYRGNPRSGGQGVYVRYLSRALIDLGHHVEVFAGQPYPELDDGVGLVEVPSLDLYRSDDPFRTPKRSEFRDWIDVLEFGSMCTAAFPEPRTFSLRARRLLAARRDDFDVVHDNQCLGYGLQRIRGLPVVATIHHPCSIDLRLELAHVSSRKRKAALKRWYSFTRMQARVARKLDHIVTVSGAAADDVRREFGVDASKMSIVHNGVDTELFRPLADVARVPGRIITTASADVPLKGLSHLIEAVAKLRTEREVELVVIGQARRGGTVAAAIEEYGLRDSIRFTSRLEWDELVTQYAEAEVAVVPSLYEGFSLPAIEAMSCEVPLVATTGGALPEVVGDAASLVPPADAGALASAIARLLDDAGARRNLGRRARERVEEHFTWRATAEAMEVVYRGAMG